MNNSPENNSSRVGPAKVKYAGISKGQFSGEVIVTVNTVKGPVTAIFPLSSVNRTSGTIDAVVIDEKADRYLVDLPTYTFTSGSKAWFSKELCII